MTPLRLSSVTMLIAACGVWGAFGSARTDTHQEVLDDDVTFDSTTSSPSSWGFMTYANTPYVACLSNGPDVSYDIAILGAPFDTVRIKQESGIC